MIVYKFGGASVKSADAVRKVGQILAGNFDELVVVISAMGKTTNLLETLVKAFFQKDEYMWKIFGQFKSYHIEITDNLFGEGKTPAGVSSFFDMLEEKLHETPSLDYDFEYDQIVSYGEMVSTKIIHPKTMKPLHNIGTIRSGTTRT